MSGAQLDATASTAGSFVYSPAAGTVLSAGSQTLSVTFTPTDTSDFTTATGSVTLVVTVNKATPTITWATPAAITVWNGVERDATGCDGQHGGKLCVLAGGGDGAGSGKPDAVGDVHAQRIRPIYNTATGSVTLTVNKATPTISWPTPAAITSGTALSATQLDATANTPGSFCVQRQRRARWLRGASQTLSVTFTPTDTTDYNTATSSVTLTLNAAPKTTPTITWPTPSAITYGTALSGAQLDATASTAGSFAYSPAAGTTLWRGEPDAVGDVHAQQYDRLQLGHGQRDADREQGDANNQLADAIRDHQRNGAERDAT